MLCIIKMWHKMALQCDQMPLVAFNQHVAIKPGSHGTTCCTTFVVQHKSDIVNNKVWPTYGTIWLHKFVVNHKFHSVNGKVGPIIGPTLPFTL